MSLLRNHLKRGFGPARLGGVGALLLAGGVAAQTNTNSPARLDYTSFRIVSERNIFNASRSGARPTRTTTETRRPVRVDSLTLVGTLDYEKGPMAFFDGSSSEFRKAVKPAGKIAGFNLAGITPQAVQLAAGTNTLELRVGMSLRREDEGEWRVSSRSESYGGSSRGESTGGSGRSYDAQRSSATGQTATSSSGAGASAGASDILKRLMEQREKEDR